MSGTYLPRKSKSTNRCQAPNQRMQRARDPDKCVLYWPHRRVADAQRYAMTTEGTWCS
jgi:hypothetical protein